MIIKQFVGVPVLVQLKNPLVGVYSDAEVTLEDGSKCGSAAIAFVASGGPQEVQPVVVQALRGNIEQVDEHYLVVATLGGDNATPVRYCVERSNVAGVAFCLEHIEVKRVEAPRIIT
jgi:hypothetical protein